MSKEREILKNVLDTQEKYFGYGLELHVEMIDIAEEIRAELAKPEPDPFAWFDDETADVWVDPVRPEHKDGYKIPLYTSPQKLIPLSEDEVCEIASEILAVQGLSSYEFARAIEAAVAKANRLRS